MLRGIRFKIPNLYFKPLAEITYGIDVDQYIWTVSDHQVFQKGGEFLFENDCYAGTDFSEIINNDIYYLIFAFLKAFPVDHDVVEITDYNEFMQSNCQIMILCCDAAFVEIYCKNASDLQLIKKNASDHYYQDIEDITDKNDQRTTFSAF